MLERESFAFDRSWLLELHQFNNLSLDALMLTITRFGNPSVVVVIAGVTLAILWWRRYRQEAKIFAIACLGAFGISRLYLGVHWPTDVIAGYGVGFLWIMICITMLKLQRLRQV